MRVTALSLLLLVPLASSSGDDHSEVLDLFASMAAALSNGNFAEFMKAFDPDMPDYDTLQESIKSLLLKGQSSSVVDPLSDEGDSAKRVVQLDWYLEFTNPDLDTSSGHRRAIITCELRKAGKHWRIVSLKPLSFFAPG